MQVQDFARARMKQENFAGIRRPSLQKPFPRGRHQKEVSMSLSRVHL